jgi:exodeoxyribonuclease VII large subunit
VAGFLIERLLDFEGALNEYAGSIVKQSLNTISENNLKLQLNTRKLLSGVKTYTNRHESKLLRLSSGSRHLVMKKLAAHERQRIRSAERLINASVNLPQRKKTEISLSYSRLKENAGRMIEYESRRIEHYTKLKKYAEPSQILKLGFSISRYKGQALKDVMGLKTGEMIETELNRGKIKSKVTEVGKKTLHS